MASLENAITPVEPESGFCSGKAGRHHGHRRWHLIALTVVLLVAGLLRFQGITNVGVRFDDESWYASDARLWHRCASVLVDSQAISAIFNRDKYAFQARMDDLGVDFRDRYYKPCQGYTFLGAMAMFVVGDRPAALAVTNAFFGTLTVLVLYFLGAAVFSPLIGLCGAFLLAVSPYHLVYSRSLFADSTTGFFILLGTLFWALGHCRRWPWKRAYVLAGMALGYSVICHYRSGYIPALFVIADLFLAHRNRTTNNASDWPGAIRRNLVFCGAVFVPVLALEGLFWAGILAAYLADAYVPLIPYSKTLINYWGVLQDGNDLNGNSIWHPEIFVAYAKYVVHWHGFVSTGLILIGTVVAARMKGVAKWPVIFAVVAIGILSFQRYRVARALSAALPFLCLLGAVGVQTVVAWCKPNKRALVPLVLLITTIAAEPAIVSSWQFMSKHSSIREACAFLESKGASSVALPMDTKKYTLYLEDGPSTIVSVDALRPSGSPARVLNKLRESGVRWMVTGPQYWHTRDPGQHRHFAFLWWDEMESILPRQARLVKEFPHLSDYLWEFTTEGWGLEHLPAMVENNAGPIRIYDLQANPRTNPITPPAPRSGFVSAGDGSP